MKISPGMKLILLLLSLILTSACPQSKPQQPANKSTLSGVVKTEVREVSGFQKVSIGGNMLVELTSGAPAFNVTLEGDETHLSLTRTEIDADGALVVELKEKLPRSNQVKVRISMPDLTELEIKGTSSAQVTGAHGDGLLVRAVGGSKVKIDGRVKSLTASTHGVSSIDAEALNAQTAEVEAAGATSIIVSPSVSLKAVTAGISTVVYTGDPKIEKTTSDTSTVKKK